MLAGVPVSIEEPGAHARIRRSVERESPRCSNRRTQGESLISGDRGGDLGCVGALRAPIMMSTEYSCPPRIDSVSWTSKRSRIDRGVRVSDAGYWRRT